ncbi:hypothetical protein LCGC14_1354240 [marine sediment metagenome]|uniref:DNA-binding response regulator n=1 Tax=marine sediment metagenome TaxID=412755 RepID=A0A0F9KW34_9ZZZZ
MMEADSVDREERQHDIGANKSRIIIVDDHPIVRQGLADLINQEEHLVVCGQVEDAPEAMKAIRELNPDMVIVDISLAGISGVELIKDIKAQHPGLPVLTFSMHEESLYAERALRAGARGYIMKREGTTKIVMAIGKILSGELYVSDAMTAKMMSRMIDSKPAVPASAIEGLSDRELEVFSLLGRGHGTRRISEELHLSLKTIETYRLRIKDKLNLTDAAELLQHAFQWVNDQQKG